MAGRRANISRRSRNGTARVHYSIGRMDANERKRDKIREGKNSANSTVHGSNLHLTSPPFVVPVLVTFFSINSSNSVSIICLKIIQEYLDTTANTRWQIDSSLCISQYCAIIGDAKTHYKKGSLKTDTYVRVNGSCPDNRALSFRALRYQ